MKLLLLFVFVILMVGGELFPPIVYAKDYILFAAEEDGPRCQIFKMTDVGDLTKTNEYEGVWRAGDSAVSPDGHLVILAGPSRPQMSAYFINRYGFVAPPTIFANSKEDYIDWNPIAFHPTIPIIYDRFYKYYYSIKNTQIEPTTHTLNADWTRAMGYSAWSNHLVCFSWNPQADLYVQTVSVNQDGSLGEIGPSIDLDPSALEKGFAFSPDGRWAAKLCSDILMIRIERDGSMSMVKSNYNLDVWNFSSIAFTSDSQRLLACSGTGGNQSPAFRMYNINQDTGEVILCSSIPRDINPGIFIQDPRFMAITPDGRYVVFNSFSGHPNMLHVVRIHDGGQLEYLGGKEVDIDMNVGKMIFAPFPEQSAASDWALYE